jgi:hypothetical protein
MQYPHLSAYSLICNINIELLREKSFTIFCWILNKA